MIIIDTKTHINQIIYPSSAFQVIELYKKETAFDTIFANTYYAIKLKVFMSFIRLKR